MRNVWFLITVAACSVSVTAQVRPPDTSVKAVLAAADAYLVDYQKQLMFLLSDERSTQEAVNWTGEVTERRQTAGDLFVTFVPADRAWVAVHDVAVVDGVPVDGHETIRQLLERNTVAGVARELFTRNARFNIGRVLRNFNEPTLALLALDRRRRSQFKFERARVEETGATSMVTIEFKETERPTLVQNGGRPVYSSGEISIEAGTGRIQRTHIRLAAEGLSADLTTTYSRDQKLDLWLPSAFTERYENRTVGGARVRSVRPADSSVVRCVSTYTNWRRFAAVSRFRPITAP